MQKKKNHHHQRRMVYHITYTYTTIVPWYQPLEPNYFLFSQIFNLNKAVEVWSKEIEKCS